MAKDIFESSDSVRTAQPLRHAQSVTFDEPFGLESGDRLVDVTVAIETYGQLNEAADNGILICHAISGDSHPDNVEEQDRVDSANLYKTLTEQVVPLYFNRDVNGVPREWIKRMRLSMATLVSQFTTDRMVKEYTNKYYLTK